MALNFPSAPVLGQVYQAEGTTFVWNGTLWAVLSGVNGGFATQPEAEAATRPDVLLSPLRAKQLITELTPPPPVYVQAAECFAWVRFNGITNAILSSFNVALVANDGSSGWYRITFGSPAVDANYIILGACIGETNHPVMQLGHSTSSPPAAASCRVICGTTGGTGKTGFVRSSALNHVSFWR